MNDQGRRCEAREGSLVSSSFSRKTFSIFLSTVALSLMFTILFPVTNS